MKALSLAVAVSSVVVAVSSVVVAGVAVVGGVQVGSVVAPSLLLGRTRERDGWCCVEGVKATWYQVSLCIFGIFDAEEHETLRAVPSSSFTPPINKCCLCKRHKTKLIH